MESGAVARQTRNKAFSNVANIKNISLRLHPASCGSQPTQMSKIEPRHLISIASHALVVESLAILTIPSSPFVLCMAGLQLLVLPGVQSGSHYWEWTDRSSVSNFECKYKRRLEAFITSNEPGRTRQPQIIPILFLSISCCRFGYHCVDVTFHHHSLISRRLPVWL